MKEKRAFGWWSPNWFTSANNRLAFWTRRKMAPLLRQTPEEVIKTSEWAVGFNIRHFGEDSGQACRAREDLAKSLDAVGRHTEARVLREQVVSACRRNRGPEDEQTLDAELWLVVSLAREGLTGEALPLAVHVRDGRRTNGTDDGKADEWVRALTRSPEPPDA